MAQPDEYEPAHEFLVDEAANTNFPGSELDIEFAALERILGQFRDNLALIQRDDGALKNGVVTTDSLASELAAVLGDPTSLADFQALVDDAEAAQVAAEAAQTAAAASQSAAATSASGAATSASTATTQATAAAASAVSAAAAAAAMAQRFTWSTNTSASDPGSGVLKANGAIGAATALYVSETDADGNSVAALLALLDDATNASLGKSLVKIAKNANNWMLAKVTAALTDNGTWDTITITVVASAGSFSASDSVYLTPILNGSDGLGTGDVSAAANFGTDNVLVRSDGTTKGVQASVVTVADTTGTMSTSGGGDLGLTSAGWGNAYFASAKKLDWGNGNVSILHSSGALTSAGLDLWTSNSTTAYCPQWVIYNGTNDANGPYYVLGSWRTGAANNGASQTSDVLGSLLWRGKDTAGTYRDAAYINATVVSVTGSAVNANINYAAGSGGIHSFNAAVSLGTSNPLTCGTIELGHASANTLSASGGDLSIEGTLVKKVGKETVWIPAAAMTPRTTNGAAAGTVEMTTNKQMFKTLDFDTATQEFAQFWVRFPKSWNVGTVTFIPIWSHASTTTNFGVVWALQALGLSDDDAGDTAFGTEQTSTDTGGTTNDIYIGPESSVITIGNSVANGDLVCFQVKRNVSDGSDTMAIDARLHGIVLLFTTNAATDA